MTAPGAKELRELSKELLDVSKRNQLINFKDRRSSTAEIMAPESDVLFTRLREGTSFETLTKDEEEKMHRKWLQNDSCQPPETDFYTDISSELETREQVLLRSEENENPQHVLRSIDRKARTQIEETGVNVAHVAFGFITWSESDSSHLECHAPVLLIPIRLEQESRIAPYRIVPEDEDVIINPAFAYKLDAEHGIKLPEFQDNESLENYLNQVRETVSKLDWEVSDSCKIGLFNFRKINMYYDMQDNVDMVLRSPFVRAVLNMPLEADEKLAFEGDSEKNVSNPLIELHSVLDADSSQIQAIEAAKSGKSFVLQGPPGTGKSQTITNIIAECLHDGKKILFVAEKATALNIVYDKLRKTGLSDSCLMLSGKVNKKEVIEDICKTFDDDDDGVAANPYAKEELDDEEKYQCQLEGYAAELHKQQSVINCSLYDLYEKYAGLRDVSDVEWPIDDIASKGTSFLTDATGLLEEYVSYLDSVGVDWDANPLYGYKYPQKDSSEETRSQLKESLNAAISALECFNEFVADLSERYGISISSVKQAEPWRDLFSTLSSSKIVTPALMKQKTYIEAQDALQRLQSLSEEITDLERDIDKVFDKGVYSIDGAQTHSLLTKQFSKRRSRRFSSEYKKLMNELNQYAVDTDKLSHGQAAKAMERLARYQRKSEEYAELEKSSNITEFVGGLYDGTDSDWAALTRQMQLLGSLFDLELPLDSFVNSYSATGFSAEKKNFAEVAHELGERIEQCESSLDKVADYFSEKIFNFKSVSSEDALRKCRDCYGSIDTLTNWCRFSECLQEIKNTLNPPDKLFKEIQPENLSKVFEKQFYDQWIDLIRAKSERLSSFRRTDQDKAVENFAKKDKERFASNRDEVRRELARRRPSRDENTPGSELSTLLRENKKKRGVKSVRKLLSEVGGVVQRIKPCFLMSPLSVSTFLDPKSMHFDLVIFDEASQIFPQDAIGAIYRADQLIVVGDSEQMPPTKFFQTSIENENEGASDVADFDSILDVCSVSIPEILLRWHYRSRYEQLIAFSNKNLYDNRLVTFPSTEPADANARGKGVDYFYVRNGTFDRNSHTNRPEAERIIELTYEHIDEFPERSLGVVAFNEAQENLIEDLLDEKRRTTPEKEFFFTEHEQEPFFVKNLETVQGDERDTVIFSATYGHDSQGRFIQNFGPLNKEGGERRLNVAITRAKWNVQLVSSMHCEDIDLKRTSSEGTRLLREYLDFAENGEVALERTPTVSQTDNFDSPFELEVCEFLRSKGFTVDTQVGCSGYRIDLALKIPNSSNYVLAIECDGATYHSSRNARDRDRLRQEILERMGWKFYRIWSTDWFSNKAIEKDRLYKAAIRDLESEGVHLTNEDASESLEQKQEDKEVHSEDLQSDDASQQENAEEQSLPTCEMQAAVSEEVDANPAEAKAAFAVAGEDLTETLPGFEEGSSVPNTSKQVSHAQQKTDGFPTPEESEVAEFPRYKTADIENIQEEYSKDFPRMIREILEEEAPLSEELLLKRIANYFGRERVTKVVEDEYKKKRRGYKQQGIVRKGGFLYLEGQTEFRLRIPGDLKRGVKDIAPEELAAGMKTLRNHHSDYDKEDLYHKIASLCGFQRIGGAMREQLDKAFEILAIGELAN